MHEALKRLIDAGWLDQLATARDEIRGHLAIVERNLDEAQGPLKYPDSRFVFAYNAVLNAATVVLRVHGVRVRRDRHHERTFDTLRQLQIPKLSDQARYYDECRRKRNAAEYDIAGGVSETEAQELLNEAVRLAAAVHDWLEHNHPELLR